MNRLVYLFQVQPALNEAHTALHDLHNDIGTVVDGIDKSIRVIDKTQEDFNTQWDGVVAMHKNEVIHTMDDIDDKLDSDVKTPCTQHVGRKTVSECFWVEINEVLARHWVRATDQLKSFVEELVTKYGQLHANATSELSEVDNVELTTFNKQVVKKFVLDNLKQTLQGFYSHTSLEPGSSIRPNNTALKKYVKTVVDRTGFFDWGAPATYIYTTIFEDTKKWMRVVHDKVIKDIDLKLRDLDLSLGKGDFERRRCDMVTAINKYEALRTNLNRLQAKAHRMTDRMQEEDPDPARGAQTMNRSRL